MKMFLTAVVFFGGFCSFCVADEVKPSRSAPKPVAAKSTGPFQVVPLAKSTTLAAKILAERQAKQKSSSAPTVTLTDIPVIAQPPQWPSTAYGIPARDAQGRVIDKVFVRVRDNRPPSLATPPPAFPFYTTRAPRSYFVSNNEQTQSESYWHNDDVQYFPPSPTPALACTANPLQTKINHLRQAIKHLTAAGMTAQAKQTQAAIKEVEREISRELLAKKVALLKELTAEIEQLRKLTSEQKLSDQQKQIAVEVQVMEVSLDKLKALGIDLAVLSKPFAGKGIVKSTGSPIIYNKTPGGRFISAVTRSETTKRQFRALLSTLQKMGVVKIIAEPKLITVSGREAWFQSGGEVRYPATDDAGNPMVKAEWFGTKLEVVPTVLPDGKIGLDIQAGVSEIDPDWMVESGTAPRVLHRMVDTYVEFRSGDTIVIGGLQSHKTIDQGRTRPGSAKSKESKRGNPGPVELIFTATAKVIDPKPASTTPKRLVPKTARRHSVVPPSIYAPAPKPSPQPPQAIKR